MIRHSIFPAIIALTCALSLASCDSAPDTPVDQTPPKPALWEVTAADGTLEGWLFGTIHSLPDGTTWETELLSDTIDDADVLIVEIAALENDAATSHTFARLARTDGLPPLSRRLPASEQAGLREMMEAGSYSDNDFTAIESWAAALMLAQGASGGDPGNGVDRALLRRFAGRPIRELEGAERQLGIFDQLPESEQRDLLTAVVMEGKAGATESAKLMSVWRSGNMEQLAVENTEGLLADLELREALLVKRNQDWVMQLVGILPDNPPALIGVGAAHMAGPDGLPALMQQRGYTVTRIQ